MEHGYIKRAWCEGRVPGTPQALGGDKVISDAGVPDITSSFSVLCKPPHTPGTAGAGPPRHAVDFTCAILEEE